MLKDIVLIRGIYALYRNYFQHSLSKLHRVGNYNIGRPLMWINPKNVIIGPSVGIGPNSYITATNARLIIKGHCSIAEYFTVHTGNHARVIGSFITDINDSNKPSGYDADVIIEEDVWIGCNVTILSGVHVGRGATIAAGAVVNKNVPPYSTVGGVPAKVIKWNWTIEEILQHEKMLYSSDDRLTKEQLQKIIEYVI